MNIKVIKNNAEHAAALERAHALLELDPQQDSPEGEELALLALTIEDYERTAFPLPPAQGKPTRNTTRVQLELPRRAYERLNALKERSDAASYSEVIKNALRLYTILSAHADEGHRIYLREPDGTLTECVVFI